MKVVVSRNEGNDANDWREAYNLSAADDKGNKLSLGFHDGEPEDATLARDFNDVYSITDLIKMAHEAGVNGEVLNIEEVKVEEDV